MDGLDKSKSKGMSKKDIQGQAAGKDNNVFLWKLFHGFYGDEDGVEITMNINTWIDLPHEYGSLDLHFVEICTDSSTLYKAGTSSLLSLDLNGSPPFTTLLLSMILIISHFRPMV
jgi:hypothetical protein